VRFVLVYVMDRAAHDDAARAIGEALAAGRLSAEIGAVYPLDRIAEAHQAVEAGQTLGKVIVTT
jgi:NADPH:quinone reductase